MVVLVSVAEARAAVEQPLAARHHQETRVVTV
jgi:hypothetical protein